ncbi:MAG: hypothetical protein LUE27_06085 [Clostridia bacterium]|nr:hypothetical protein [Clostridia bacterium]
MTDYNAAEHMAGRIKIALSIMAGTPETKAAYEAPTYNERQRGRVLFTDTELSWVPEEMRSKLNCKFKIITDPDGTVRYQLEDSLFYFPKGADVMFGQMKRLMLLQAVMQSVSLKWEKTYWWILEHFGGFEFYHYAMRLSFYLTLEERKEFLDIMYKDLHPYIGGKGIFEITEEDITDCIKRVADTGDYERAQKVLDIVEGVYDTAGKVCSVKCPVSDVVIISASPKKDRPKAFTDAKPDAVLQRAKARKEDTLEMLP